MRSLDDYRIDVITKVACPECGSDTGQACTEEVPSRKKVKDRRPVFYVHDDRSYEHYLHQINIGAVTESQR